MKKTIMMVAIALTMAACGTQSTKENAKEMNTLTFTTEQAAFMSAIACNEASQPKTVGCSTSPTMLMPNPATATSGWSLSAMNNTPC